MYQNIPRGGKPELGVCGDRRHAQAEDLGQAAPPCCSPPSHHCHCSITWPSFTSPSIPGPFSSKAVPETGTECPPDPLPSEYQALVFPNLENWVAEMHGAQCGVQGVVWKDFAIRACPALPKHWTFTLNSAWEKVLMDAIL